MSASAAKELGPGTRVGGRYTVVRRIGEGGMGTVYAVERDDGTRWALKTLTAAFTQNETALRRFFREARLSADIRNDHVAPVQECGTDQEHGAAFMVMPLLEGEDLGDLLKRVGPLEPSVALRIVLQAARGLVAAHELGILHRDVKPSNLFLHREGERVTVKVCDFGIGKALGSAEELTATGSMLGSPLYMAPEQFTSAKHVDFRADVWSLAMTLYEALAGESPYRDLTSFADVVMAVTTRDVPPLQDVAPWVPAPLAETVHAALIRDVKARCPSMDAFVDALQQVAGAGETGAALAVAELRSLPPATRGAVAPRAQRPASWLALAMTGTLELPVDPLIGKVLGGKYKVVRLLGRGGMGAVYEATAPDGSEVAIKVVIEERANSKDAVRRFLREARSAVAVQHEHVVRVLDADTDAESGAPYIVMELLHGTDLSTVLRRHGALAPRAACRLFVDACRGVAAAHALGIIHRDIKPANIFLHEAPDGRLTVKICDFGVAKRVLTGEAEADATGTGADLTQTGGMVGSPVYMSPEQARNAKEVDRRSDVWSLGITLHEALTGERPWGDVNSSVGELILALCTKDVPSVQDRAPWVEPRLAEAVHRALIREADERYPSAREFADALEPFAMPAGTPLTIDALASLSDEDRRRAAPRSAQVGTASIGGAASTATPRAAPSRAPWVAAGLVAVAAVAAAAVFSARPSTEVAPLPSAAAATVSAAAKARVEVPVSPATATVTVGGVPRALQAGALVLEGDPGETFTVGVSADGVVKEFTVVMRRDGTAQPDRLVVEAPAPSAAASASAAPAPTATAPAAAAGGRPRPGSARPPGAAPTATAPAAAAPTRPPDTGLQPSTDWR